MKIKSTILFCIFIVLALVLLILALSHEEYEAGASLVFISLIWPVFFVFLYGKQHIFLGINALLIFLSYVIAHRLTFHSIGSKALIMYALLALTLTLVCILLNQEKSIRWRLISSIATTLLNIVVYSVPAFYIGYFLMFNVGVTRDVVDAILQTNPGEAVGFVLGYYGAQRLSFGLVILTALITAFTYTMYRLAKKDYVAIKTGYLGLLILICSGIIYVQRGDLRLMRILVSNAEAYQAELAAFQALQAERGRSKSPITADKENGNEIYFVVIGESLNKMHMGIYGYPRNSTPLLQKFVDTGELLLFTNAYSIHTHTMPVLSQALTESNQANGKNYFESVSILEAMKAAGVETLWITNQMLYGLFDNFTTVLAQGADQLISRNTHFGFYTETEYYDGDMVDDLKGYIHGMGSTNQVVFIHLMGSHWPYCERFPPESGIFKGQLDPRVFGSLASNESLPDSLNCYDNSVLYNDMVVASLLQTLQQLNRVSGFVYFADHAEDVFSLLGHQSDQFTYSMTTIPMLTWFSDSYKTKYPGKYDAMKANQEALFSNDFIYDTLLGIVGINTANYEPNHDLSNQAYFLDPRETRIFDGTKYYASADNIHYQQSRNLLDLAHRGLLAKTGVADVKTLGKLSNVINSKITNVHARVWADSDGRVFVGDEGSTFELSTFMAAIFPATEATSVLLEIVQSDQMTAAQLGETLQSISPYHKTGRRILVAVPFEFHSNQVVKNAGYPIVFRITQEDFSTNSEISGDKGSAEPFWIERLREQHTDGLLIDSQLYRDLTATMNQVPPHHEMPIFIQESGPGLREPNFLESTKENNYWSDPEVKLILVDFYTPFEM